MPSSYHGAVRMLAASGCGASVKRQRHVIVLDLLTLAHTFSEPVHLNWAGTSEQCAGICAGKMANENLAQLAAKMVESHFNTHARIPPLAPAQAPYAFFSCLRNLQYIAGFYRKLSRFAFDYYPSRHSLPEWLRWCCCLGRAHLSAAARALSFGSAAVVSGCLYKRCLPEQGHQSHTLLCGRAAPGQD